MEKENQTIKEIGREVAGAFYDYQQVRLSSMNRIRDVIRKRSEGIAFDAVEKKIDKDKKKFDKKYNDKALLSTINKMKEEGKITDKEYDYIQKSLKLSDESKKIEEFYKTMMLEYVQQEPIFQEFLSKIKGLGPVLSCNLLKNFGYCERYEHISSLWKHSGFAVIDGHAPKREKGKTIDYNPKLRTLMWKITDSFIKQNSPVYRGIYDNEKKRQLARKDENKPKSQLHAHLRAMRKTTKIFLSHYWVVGRTLSQLPVSEPYVGDKLGHQHIITWREVVQANEDLQDIKHRKPKMEKIKPVKSKPKAK